MQANFDQWALVGLQSIHNTPAGKEAASPALFLKSQKQHLKKNSNTKAASSNDALRLRPFCAIQLGQTHIIGLQSQYSMRLRFHQFSSKHVLRTDTYMGQHSLAARRMILVHQWPADWVTVSAGKTVKGSDY